MASLISFVGDEVGKCFAVPEADIAVADDLNERGLKKERWVFGVFPL